MKNEAKRMCKNKDEEGEEGRRMRCKKKGKEGKRKSCKKKEEEWDAESRNIRWKKNEEIGRMRWKKEEGGGGRNKKEDK